MKPRGRGEGRRGVASEGPRWATGARRGRGFTGSAALGLWALCACQGADPARTAEARGALSRWTASQTLTAPGAVGGEALGNYVALDLAPDFVIAGQPGRAQGGALVFPRQGLTLGAGVALDPTSTEGRSFGHAVAGDGDAIAVGKPEGSSGDEVVLYHRSGTAWAVAQRLTGRGGRSFGQDVALRGDTAMVLERYWSSVHVYERSGTQWAEGVEVTDPSMFEPLNLVLDGDLALVGSDVDGTRGARAGAAHVLRRNGTTWAHEQKLFASDAAPGDIFGTTTAIDAATATAFVAADERQTGGVVGAGAVYVFVHDGSAWVERQRLEPEPPVQNQYFGISLAYRDGTLWVGSVGTVFEYARSGDTFSQVGSLTGSPSLGMGLAFDGALLVGAAPSQEPGGALHTFVLGCTELPAGTRCDDGNACTAPGTCGATGCEGQAPVADGTACGAGSCEAGVCVFPTGTGGAGGGAGAGGGGGSAGSGGAGAVSGTGGSGGAPVPPTVSGAVTSCASDAECASGHCVDLVCCDAACDAPCHSCALPGSVGVCTESPTGVDLRGDCGGPLSCLSTCGPGGQCVGAGAGTQCTPPQCLDATRLRGPAFCPSLGAACPADAVGTFDCAPYVCVPVLGACRADCSVSGDCASGNVCSGGRCVPVTPAAAEDSGCGCRMAGGAGGAPRDGALVLHSVVLGWLVRRGHVRRRAARSAHGARVVAAGAMDER